jgi:hypothetical protein
MPDASRMLTQTSFLLQVRPVGFKFYYMTAMDPKLNPVVKKFLAPGIDPSTVDQVTADD